MKRQERESNSGPLCSLSWRCVFVLYGLILRMRYAPGQEYKDVLSTTLFGSRLCRPNRKLKELSRRLHQDTT